MPGIPASRRITLPGVVDVEGDGVAHLRRAQQLRPFLHRRRQQVLVEGESKLVSKQASYPSSKVELGWERRQGHFSDPVPTPTSTTTSRTQLVGRTGGDQVVVFDGDLSLKGELLDVEITDARNLTLFARPLQPALP